MKTHIRNISLAFLAGIAGFAAFPPLDISFAAWFCLLPLLLTVEPGKPRENFFYGYLAGVVFFASLLYWLVNVSVPGMIILVLALSVFYGLFALLAGYIRKYSMSLLILPFIWVVLEFIRGNLFTGFPWALLGYTQYRNLNLIQIADITGTYGVSFIIVAFNTAVYAVSIRSKRRISYMMIALIFMLASTSYGIYRLNNLHRWGSPRISVVQGNIPQSYKWDPSYADEIMAGYTALTRQAAGDDTSLIIWPETSYPYLFEEGTQEAETIKELASEVKTPILAGMVSRRAEGYYNTAVLFDGAGRIREKYLKTHLVPFGEYVPFEGALNVVRKYIDKPIGDFEEGDEYTVFPVSSLTAITRPDGTLVRTTNFFRFGVLICFEDIFPYITRNFVNNGANFMVNMTNDAWFGKTAAPLQHMQASVFRAVENRVPVIRAANTGISCFIDPQGKVTEKVQSAGENIFIKGYATSSVNVLYGKSYYTVYGDLFVYFCAFMLAVLFITEGFLLRKENRS
ncbi:MAG: apolipoprotein N-acyltransferase [Candidatus Omnitrophica bacterium]|nr:apolipoprotein N-acyltransferase [Candidatus Omnitrophota bacterium]